MISGIAPVVLDTLKISTIDSDVSKYFRNMVEETVEYREKNHVKRNDFLQMLIQLKNKGQLDDEEKTEDQNNETNKNTETAEGTYTRNYITYFYRYFTGKFTFKIIQFVCISNCDLFRALSLRLIRNSHICLQILVFSKYDASGGAERGEAYSQPQIFRNLFCLV
jgi:hypothetical protein